MSDIPPTSGGNEIPAAGRPMGQIGMGVGLNLPALDSAKDQLNAVKGALSGLRDALRELGSNSYMLSQGVNNLFSGIAKNAQTAASSVTSLSGALGGVGGGGGGPTRAPNAPSGGSGAGWVGGATASASAAVAAAGGGGGYGGGAPYGYGGGGGGIPPVGMDFTSALVGLNTGDFLKDVAMFPLRFMRSQIETNRQTALTTASAMSRVSFGTGVGMQDIAAQLARRPGGTPERLFGTTSDMLSLFSAMPGYGAMFSFGGGANAPRAGGFLRGVGEMQQINPGAPLAQIAGTLGGFAGNTAAQQASMMLTGGAMGMIKRGGGQKSLTEWADDVLKWLSGLRGGANQGKGFGYDELIAQYFPGSNIDAWFEATGVPTEMREYWWSYALSNSRGQSNTADWLQNTYQQQAGNPLLQRLKATTQMTTGQFGLAGTMMGQYANKEQANQWFNRVFADFLQNVIPSVTTRGNLGFAQFMPDTMEQMLMQLLERSGGFGAAAGGILGYGGGFGKGPGVLEQVWGSMTGGLLGRGLTAAGTFGLSELLGAGADILPLPESWADRIRNPWSIFGGGDIGDDGIYTSTGGTGTAGLHPDMRRKVNAMMRANPRLRMTSGLRDNRMQQTLRGRGVGRVSGRPSSHTRGMAADLGPRSEYPWIAANASKFGLSSGVGMGEPWHVGMGDIGDSVWEELFKAGGGLFTGFKALLTEDKPESLVKGIVDILDPILSLMQGLISGEGVDTTKLAVIPNLYDMFVSATRDRALGGIPAGGGAGQRPSVRPLPGGGGPGTQQAGIAAATALFNAGFRNRKDLETITAISWRESKWNPLSRNPNTSDRGLMQINMSAHRNTMRQMGYTEADLLDIQKNANIAYRLWSSGGANWDSFQQLWGFSENSPYSEPVPNRPGWDRNGDPLGRTAASNAPAIVAAANLPTIGDIEAAATLVQGGGGRFNMMTFNNTFKIEGGGSSNGGIDMRRTVTMIADHLEDEMRQRMLRAS